MNNDNAPNSEEHKLSSKGTLSVSLFILIMVSISAFYMEMRHSSQDDQEYKIWLDIHAEDAAEAASRPEAPKYRDIPGELFNENRDWVNSLNKLTRMPVTHHETPMMTDEERALAVKLRGERRAYNGAPPVIPHAINTRDTQSCVVCHAGESPVVMAGKAVPQMSHEYLKNCVQCHAPSVGKDFMTDEACAVPFVENSFQGLPSAGKGSRAYDKAPPVIPHHVHMRQNCMACHGEGMVNAIRSSHPQRQNCQQCHAMQAGYDNRERFNLNR